MTKESALAERYIVCSSHPVMSLVKLLGFRTIACGCVVGCYRERATEREVRFVEEKGAACTLHAHRRNQTIAPEPPPASPRATKRAS